MSHNHVCEICKKDFECPGQCTNTCSTCVSVEYSYIANAKLDAFGLTPKHDAASWLRNLADAVESGGVISFSNVEWNGDSDISGKITLATLLTRLQGIYSVPVQEKP